MEWKQVEAIGFDLDGTLWDGTEAIAGAWRLCLKEEADILHIPSADELKGFMGLPVDIIMQKCFPDVSPQRRSEIISRCMEAERHYIARHGGILFAGVEETLQALSERYRLFIVSNCQEGYIETFLQHYGFEAYFCDHECIGRTGKAKGENIRTVMKRNSFGSAVYIGDTQGDYDAAQMAEVPFLFAKYGFGTVETESYITSFPQLSNLFL